MTMTLRLPKLDIDAALASIDRQREQLCAQFRLAMAKLDNDERDLLMLKPVDDGELGRPGNCNNS